METSPEPSFPLIGDCIGCESCVEAMPLIGADSVRNTRIATKPRRVKKTENPPPMIPLLARTGNLHPRMPWVLRRHYTADGRLILREEKVRHHEYFRAHRSGGRLTLQLVRVEDNGFELPAVNPDDYENDVSNSLLHSEEDVSNSLLHSEEDVSNSSLQSKEDVSNSLLQSKEDVSNSLLHSKKYVSNSLLHSKEDVSNSCLHSKEDVSDSFLQSKEDTYHEEEEQKDDDNEKQYPLVSETEVTVGSDSGSGAIRGSGEWKCLYKTVSPSSSCIFGVPIHSLGPVLG